MLGQESDENSLQHRQYKHIFSKTYDLNVFIAGSVTPAALIS